MREELFFAHDVEREYAMLLGLAFGELTKPDQIA